MYTPTQKNIVKIFANGCNDYLLKWINYTALNFPTGIALSKSPETLDKLLNLYRAKDMCTSFLTDHTLRKTGHYLEELSTTQIDNFLNNYDPIDLSEFFQQEPIIKDFILENELGQTDVFKNDPEFQNLYAKFINLAKTRHP